MFSAGLRNRCSVGVLAGAMVLGFVGVSGAQDQNKDAKVPDSNGAEGER
jgi:hypothetical protein